MQQENRVDYRMGVLLVSPQQFPVWRARGTLEGSTVGEKTVLMLGFSYTMMDVERKAPRKDRSRDWGINVFWRL